MWQGDRDAGEPANCGWVEFNNYVLVIDANFPLGAKKILPEIRRTTKKPLRLRSTRTTMAIKPIAEVNIGYGWSSQHVGIAFWERTRNHQQNASMLLP